MVEEVGVFRYKVAIVAMVKSMRAQLARCRMWCLFSRPFMICFV